MKQQFNNNVPGAPVYDKNGKLVNKFIPEVNQVDEVPEGFNPFEKWEDNEVTPTGLVKATKKELDALTNSISTLLGEDTREDVIEDVQEVQEQTVSVTYDRGNEEIAQDVLTHKRGHNYDNMVDGRLKTKEIRESMTPDNMPDSCEVTDQERYDQAKQHYYIYPTFLDEYLYNELKLTLAEASLYRYFIRWVNYPGGTKLDNKVKTSSTVLRRCCGLSNRSLKTALDRLIKLGLIERTHTGTHAGDLSEFKVNYVYDVNTKWQLFADPKQSK